MKALAVAVDQAVRENIEKKIEPVDESSKKVNQELYDLLARGYEMNKPPHEYFLKRPNLSKTSQITSPRVLAEVCLTSNATQWVVASMIQHQFDIKWDTPTGKPADDYSFYDFCNTEKTKKFFVYKTRQAHVKATLYKEYCKDPKKYEEILDDALRKSKKTLCPKVYFSTINGWMAWQAYDEEQNEREEFREVDFPEWIDKDIRKFIKEHADTQTLDDESLKNGKTNPLEKPTLYWAVIKDRDFPSDEDKMDRLELKPIGQTQVYVGKANNGIKGRWLEDSDNHCQMIKKCLDNVGAMTTYDPMRLEGIQLVDARLALAKVREEEMALFVIKTFGDDLEKAENDVQEAKASLHKAEESLREAKTSLQLREAEEQPQSSQRTQNASSTESAQTDDIPCELESLQADVEKRQEELDRANKAVLKLRSKAKSELRDDGIDQLKRAENSHLKGYREEKPCKISIISSQEPRMKWEPTNMAYGMNCRKGK